MERIRIQGIDFHNVTLSEAVDVAAAKIKNNEKCVVFTPNAEIVRACKKDGGMKRLLNSADLVLPDGIGIVYAAKILGTPLKGRVPGIDFASALMARLTETGDRLFLLGARPGVAEKAAENLKARYPGLQVCGVMHGYFSNDAEGAAAIAAAASAAVFVCLGFPKQERFIATYKDALPACLFAGLGGSMDIFAGVAKRAPDLFIRLGLEWLYRLFCDPSRMGRMLRLPLFMLDVAKERLQEGKR